MVSIIIPSYNCKDYIIETLHSVLNQTFSDYEVLIVDDKSTDGTPEVIKSAINLDKRFRLVLFDKNQGVTVARNKGIEMASGEFIAFLDGDDLWEPAKLEKQIDFMKKNGYPFTYTYYEKIDSYGNPSNIMVTSPDEVDYRKMLKSNYIGCSTVIYNQNALGKIYMPNIRKRQDYGMWLKILKITDKGYCLKECLMRYRIRPDSISSNKLGLVRYNWRLFRTIEGFGVIKSLYYLFYNIFNKIIQRSR
ncbi:MAG: glycosyltransferase family 2 protein [Eubacteriales bacterium]|nr:glycosyltransferase family 2 protein [Eubacteriales bacterium]